MANLVCNTGQFQECLEEIAAWYDFYFHLDRRHESMGWFWVDIFFVSSQNRPLYEPNGLHAMITGKYGKVVMINAF